MFKNPFSKRKMNFQKTFVIAIFGYSKKPWLMNFICENMCGISLTFYHHLGEQGEANGGAPDDGPCTLRAPDT